MRLTLVVGRPVDWAKVAAALVEDGWIRLQGAVDDRTCADLAKAAPSTWAPLPEVEGRVRQGGLSCGVFFDDAPMIVQHLGREICTSLTDARPNLPPVPCFNEVQWGRSDNGVGFITPHRDPPGAGGTIAIVTLSGCALFRVWQVESPRVGDRLTMTLRHNRGGPGADYFG